MYNFIVTITNNSYINMYVTLHPNSLGQYRAVLWLRQSRQLPRAPHERGHHRDDINKQGKLSFSWYKPSNKCYKPFSMPSGLI